VFLGAVLFLGVAAFFVAVGFVTFWAVVLLAVTFLVAVAFLAVDFFAAVFFVAVAFFTAVFFTAVFLGSLFFVAAFFVGSFFTAVFFVAVFFAAAFAMKLHLLSVFTSPDRIGSPLFRQGLHLSIGILYYHWCNFVKKKVSINRKKIAFSLKKVKKQPEMHDFEVNKCHKTKRKSIQ
jgi:hypothetical protein